MATSQALCVATTEEEKRPIVQENYLVEVSRNGIPKPQMTELQALKMLVKALAAGAEVEHSRGVEGEHSLLVEIEVRSHIQGRLVFNGSRQVMRSLQTAVFYHDRACKLQMGYTFFKVSDAEKAAIQQMKEALPRFTRPDGPYVLFVVLALGISEEPDLTAASRLGLDDLFTVIEIMQETGWSLWLVEEELTT